MVDNRSDNEKYRIVDFEYDEKRFKRVDKFGKKYILVDNIQGSKMLFGRYPYRKQQGYELYYGQIFYGAWEPLITAFVKKIVRPDMKVADVGVYLGYYSLLMSHLMGDTGEVHAFEPSKESLDDLMLAVDINNYKNIIPHRMAISNFDGEVDFDNNTFLLTDDEDNRTKESVECKKFDSLGIDLDFVKVDTDGFDGNVVDGAIEMIKRCGTVFLIEYFPQMWHKVGMKPSEFLHKLGSSDLNCYILGLDLKLKDIDVDKLLKYPRIQHLTPEEILCSPFPDISLIISSQNAKEIEGMLI